MVICNESQWCDEAPYCGGGKPHDLCQECGNCPRSKTSKCIEIPDSRISYEQYMEWRWKPKNKHLRFGQEFINTMFPSITDPDLFYQESRIKAEQMIMTRYVKRHYETD